MSDSNYRLMDLHLQTFLPFEILRLREKGGPSEWETESAIAKCQEMLEPATHEEIGKGAIPWQGGAELLYRLSTTGLAMGVLMRALAVMSFCPGGIEFCGVRYFGNIDDQRQWQDMQQVRATATANSVSAAEGRRDGLPGNLQTVQATGEECSQPEVVQESPIAGAPKGEVSQTGEPGALPDNQLSLEF